MCYKVSTASERKLRAYLEPEDYTIREYQQWYYQAGHIHAQVPVIKAESQNEVQQIQWGIKPWWPVADYKEAVEHENRTLNTMSEYAFRKLPFEQVIKQERCLTLIDGFYEWKHETPKLKTPHYIYMPDQQPFAVPSILWQWVTPDGELIESVSLLTTKANELMAAIHNSKKRMPAIIDKEQWAEWLDLSRPYKAPVPYPEGALCAHEISKNVTKRGFDPNIPEIQLPIS